MSRIKVGKPIGKQQQRHHQNHHVNPKRGLKRIKDVLHERLGTQFNLTINARQSYIIRCKAQSLPFGCPFHLKRTGFLGCMKIHHLKHQHTNDKNQCKEFSSVVTSIHLVIYIGDPCLYGKHLPFQPRHSGRQETIEVAPLIRAGSLRLDAIVEYKGNRCKQHSQEPFQNNHHHLLQIC